MELVLVGDKPLVEAAVVTFDTGAEALLIDATRLGFACPLDLAGVVATAHWASAAAMPIALKLPQDPSVASYLQRMDVLRLMPSQTKFLGRVGREARADLRNRLLEVTHVTPENVDGVASSSGDS